VWYVSYGSNLSRERFDCYLTGGTPPHAGAPNPGARDPSPPAGDRAVALPGTVWFASSSRRWGGAVAFYDHEARRPGHPTLARAYLLTAGQLLDVAAQELGLPPGSFADLPAVDADRAVPLDPGRYGTLVGCQPIAGTPAVTLTAPWRLGDEDPGRPSLAYLRTIGGGLAESHHLAPADQARYLAGLPGAAGAWDEQALAQALA
jgi:hypothetical protein